MEDENLEMSPACSPVCPGIRRAMLFVLLLSGLCSCLHHYHFIKEPKTWHEAQKYCRARYSDLATIDSMEDMEQLLTVAGSYEGEVWIGLLDKPSAWDWSLTNSSYYTGQDRDFRRWSDGRPHIVDSNQWLCAAFWQGVWKDYACSEEYSFVCYNGTPNDLAPTSYERYTLIKTKKSWFKAQSYCRQLNTSLVSVRNATENAKIQQLVPPKQLAWLGLHRRTWSSWSDSAPLRFANWAKGHPFKINESCAVSVINGTHPGKWVERPCDEKLHFMCHNNKSQLFNIKLTALKSTIALSDHAVMDAILNLVTVVIAHVQEKMKEKGITRDVRVSWIKKQDEDILQKAKEKVDLVKTDL